ncbi:hypothetical protein glysoja_018874 [Glycine soja]|nr:hypothetical protein glysoja_018874 [Glycine soja]
MGLLWWRKGNKPQPQLQAKSSSIPKSNGTDATKPLTEAPGMNGAVEVPRPPNTTVSIFEFGFLVTVLFTVDALVFKDLKPCHWEILPAVQSNAPQFRVVF